MMRYSLGHYWRLWVVSKRVPLVWPVHPRTRGRLTGKEWSVSGFAEPTLVLMEPLGYLEFLAIMAGARLVLTDSGGSRSCGTATPAERIVSVISDWARVR